jgi:phytoene dehydrogenase-like protein
MKSKDFSADFIVIGSGLGGLVAAAYLSRTNYRVIVLERNSEIGGKCTTRTVNGYRYVIGANTFGSRTAFTLKDLGINLEWIPAPLRLYGKNGYLSFPLNFSSISELKYFGINFFPLLKMCSRLGISMLHQSFTTKTYRDLVDYLIKEPDARELLYCEAWYIGAHPDWLSASSLKLFLGTYYGYNKPIYPLHGAQAIPNALADYIKAHGGEVLTKQNVKIIGIDKGITQGVQVGNNWFSAKQGVISNAEIGQTFAMIRSKRKPSFNQNIDSSPKNAFPLALLLLILDTTKAPSTIIKPSLPSETNATILSRPICEVIDELKAGQINISPVCNLILSELKSQLISGANLTHLPVHVSILWPKKSPKHVNFKAITQSILTEIDKRYPGFADSILSSKWLTPEDYEKSFGFSSNPAPVLETPIFTKQSWKLPINRLYNVGTSVLPTGSHAGCAIESGIRCAKDILNSN